jgi:hypothetical protein
VSIVALRTVLAEDAVFGIVLMGRMRTREGSFIIQE